MHQLQPAHRSGKAPSLLLTSLEVGDGAIFSHPPTAWPISLERRGLSSEDGPHLPTQGYMNPWVPWVPSGRVNWHRSTEPGPRDVMENHEPFSHG